MNSSEIVFNRLFWLWTGFCLGWIIFTDRPFWQVFIAWLGLELASLLITTFLRDAEDGNIQPS